LETGGGLLFAKKFLENEEDFIIMNADILTDLDISALVKFHKSHDNVASLAVSDRPSSRKLLFNKEMVLRGWMNKNTGETKLAEFNNDFKELSFSGIHCLHSSIFDKIKRTGTFSIMEEYLDLMFDKHILGFEHHAHLIDVGRPESVLEAEKYFK
jgi:NDP-sugar pyrophosphorylase family protein